MVDENKPIVHLPQNPDNYYGIASTMQEIFRMDQKPVFYIGPSRYTEEMKAISCRILADGTYEFTTDKAILIGTEYTRVNLKCTSI